ncbi:MAG: hypothetical protein H0T46_20935, partial [Deltaproteobacteria bacterium]|nr:hypothetical protein [Deltaproteobacteria bacterium]
MKLLKQTKLVFHEGRSDKVYEIDLCEVGTNQFVVNFRYGKLGGALKDGSKTVAPVKRDEADRVFDKLVRSKIESGYVDASTARPTAAPAPTAARVPAPPPAPGTVPVSRDPRAQKILERLAATGSDRRWFRGSTSAPTWPLERAIWRAGELGIKEAEPQLIALINTATSSDVDGGGKGMRDYCIAWALGRCGSAAGARALAELYGDRRTPDHVKRIAAESLLLLSDAESNAEFKAHHIDRLPAPLKAAALTGDPEAFAAALDAFPLDQHASVLHELYLADTPVTRPAFLDALGKSPLRAPLFQQLRYIFKAAELRRDARVFGIFGYRVETTAANYKRSYR